MALPLPLLEDGDGPILAYGPGTQSYWLDHSATTPYHASSPLFMTLAYVPVPPGLLEYRSAAPQAGRAPKGNAT